MRQRRHDELRPKAFAVLRYLAEHPGQLVTKAELVRVVWPDTVIGDEALTACIREIRQVLGDQARGPQYIETVHRRGYRFIGPMRGQKSRGRDRVETPSIVVLPFVNLSGDPEQEYFSDGITEELTASLSRLSGLFVISRNTAFFYKGKAVKTQDLSTELGVRYVLEGSTRKTGDQVRITAQLIDATTDHHLWSERYDRPLTDLFALVLSFFLRDAVRIGTVDGR
ncbi:MAG TPA: winged helix-turn-helix domain-containing protein [Candidatus Binatia bacterium]|nr:winged helix-turn-helix domain-containing protein [Candidatus Binatia bacterium]